MSCLLKSDQQRIFRQYFAPSELSEMIWDSCIFLDISEPALSLILGILCSITLPPRFRLSVLRGYFLRFWLSCFNPSTTQTLISLLANLQPHPLTRIWFSISQGYLTPKSHMILNHGQYSLRSPCSDSSRWR
jgi:hypothetical protein